MQYNSGSCKRCPLDNCKTCSSTGNNECTECMSGYILNDDQCKPCHSSCEECSGIEDYQCIKCPSGSFDEIPDDAHHYCHLCDPNCLRCEDKDNCDECNPGYYKTQTNKCSKCDISCKECTGSTNEDCISCNDGYYQYGNQCRQCDSNCKTCEGKRDSCTSCKDGFYVNENKICANCDENCKICNGPNKCTSCNDGFLIDKNGVCIECGESLHCKVCQFVGSSTTKTECLECADNAYPSQTYWDNTVSCSLCPSTCQTCHDKDFCTSCISGYYLYREKCEKCNEGCSSCEKTPDFCTSCLPGYRLDSTQNSCIKCPEGCIDCESDTKCSSCQNGFYLDHENCKKCDISCKTCTDGTNACSECAIGYVFNQFKICIKCPPNCTICDSTGCLDCDPEFFPLIDGTCMPCSDVCFECTGPTENDCYECDPGYYFESKLKQCVQCNQACKTCNGPRDSDCQDCAKGFWHTTRFDYETYEDIPICGPCEYACAECTDDEICTVCNDGFRVYKGIKTPDCEACKKGCKKCDDGKDLCTECFDTFYVSSSNGNYVNCSSCPSNCKRCSRDQSNKVICHECLDGFYASGGKCLKCNSPCATCSSATKCTSCIAGHLYDGEGSCDAECHPDCFTCERTQTTCTSCHEGQYLVNNTCIKCPLEGCKKCIIGEHTSTCRECLDGFYKDDFFDSCYECDKSCATCSSQSSRNCLSCANGYYVKSTSGSHVTCSPCTEADTNCLECHQECSSDCDNCNLICTRCVEGYSFINNQCIKCHESCKTCDGPLDTDCVTCKDNYFLNSEQKCSQCSDSCVNCEENDKKCTSCKSHYYVNNGVCEECSSSCLDCTGTSTNCTSCPSNKYYYQGKCYDSCDQVGKGFGYNNEKECVKCLIYNCLEYDNICQCTKCANGYQIYTDPITTIEICQSCGINHCKEFDDSCQCVTCENGYQMTIDPTTKKGICKSCNVDYCIEYNDACQCSKCQNGYKTTLDQSTKKEICTSCNVDNCVEYNENCQCKKCNDGFAIVIDPNTMLESCVESKPEEILPGQNCGGIIKCEFDSKKDDNEPNPNPIIIESGTFHNVIDKEDGGAIYLSNKVVEIKKSVISDCQSIKKGGGIFVNLDQPLEKPIIFEHLTISNCQATAGGAIYAYSDKQENEIKIISCKFQRCKANTSPVESKREDFGGSALYLHVINGLVNGCEFVNNGGNMIKVNNNFDGYSKRLMMKNIKETNSISIKNCLFDSEKVSSSSLIYYLRGKSEVPAEVKDCTFRGKLTNGSHYIDGDSLNDMSNMASKIRIESCKFESDSRSAVNLKKLGILSSSLDANSHKFNHKKEIGSNLNALIVLALSCIMIIIVISALIIFINEKKKEESFST